MCGNQLVLLLVVFQEIADSGSVRIGEIILVASRLYFLMEDAKLVSEKPE